MDDSLPPREDALPSVKTTFLHLLVGAIAITAAIGIAVILLGRFSWIEIRVLLTTTTVAGASVFGLACGACLEQKRGGPLPLAGISFTIVAALLIVVGMWADFDGNMYWRLTASVSIFAASFSHLALLALASRAPRWATGVTTVSVLTVAVLAMLALVFDVDGTIVMRTLGVAAIVDGAMTVTTPILHRLSPTPPGPQSELAAIDDEIAQLEGRLVELRRRRSATVAARRSA